MKSGIITKIIASVAISVIAISSGFAQTNLGQECGCPPMGSRTTVSMASLGVNANNELLASQTLTCDKIYTLDRKLYVPNGLTLTVNPGTVIQGIYNASPVDAAALIIERGAKIIADGTAACPIVMTSTDDNLSGSYNITNVGRWGGLVLLGTASNNLVVGNTLCVNNTPGLGYIEGFTASNGRDNFGYGDAAFPTANDNDNSGILRYVSIRHAGALIVAGNELNGLSLGAVGRGTTIEHVELVSAADDNIEVFGGTVNLKYISTLFGDDDMLDWDLGWTGKTQFYFAIAGDSLTGLHSTDNGFEGDNDDQSKASFPRTHPIIYNTTIISNGHIFPTADNSGPAAIQGKELTGGEIYNSIFANFRSGLHLATARSNATNKGDAYDNWTDAVNAYNSAGGNAQYHSLIVKNNTFIGFGSVPTKAFYITTGALTQGGTPKLYKPATAASAADVTQFTTTDNNAVVASVAGIDYNWAWNTAAHLSYSTNSFHMTPLTNIASTTTPPADGFFSTVNYRGAFDANKGSWLSDWALCQVLTSQASNPTDLDNDGDTDIDDFSIFISRFGEPNR